jgi:hypothetical protein
MPRIVTLLDFITLAIFGEAYKLRRSLLRCILHPHTISSLLGRNIPSAPCSKHPQFTVRVHRALTMVHCNSFIVQYSRDSAVGIAVGYGLDGQGSRVRFPAGAGNFSLHHRVQNGSGAHPASYPMVTIDSFLGDKAAGA